MKRRRRRRSAWRAIGHAISSGVRAVTSFASVATEQKKLARTFKRKPPKLRAVECPEGVCGVGGWAGKYDPKKRRATLAMEKTMPAKMRKALRAHEQAHHYVCDRTKRNGLRKCTYKGEHDKRFYRTLAKVHRTIGTDPHAAMELERRSGYRPPKGFSRAIGVHGHHDQCGTDRACGCNHSTKSRKRRTRRLGTGRASR